MVISTIRVGYRIKTQTAEYTVKGSTKIRGRYCYTVSDKGGRKFSLSRDDLLEAQRDGSATILANEAL